MDHALLPTPSALAFLLLTAGVAMPLRASTVARTAFVMGTRVELRVEGEDREAAIAASEAALRALEETEDRLSTWRDGSELSRFNRSPVGDAFRSSPELFEELRAAVACSDVTQGAFDPSIGPLVRAWGLRAGGRQPSEAELASSIAAVGLDGLELRSDRTLARRRPDLVLEEGAFGKGAGLDRAVERIARTPGVTAAVVDLGGQVMAWRAPRDGGREGQAAAPIEIAVADPLQRDVAVVALSIESGSLSTSGSSERGITVGDRHLSHLLDPRTGRPAPDFGSVTVWAPTGLDADCLSTGLYVLGMEGVESWASRHPEIGVLVVGTTGADGRRLALASAAFAGRVEPLRPDVLVRWMGTEKEEAPKPAPGSRTKPSRFDAGELKP
ncbi:MAG TPA: FAD:protein FMN transferase [Thermoanaerobaculia bacterium]|nr:FAD:protein FMN transferase [Thermoanaerobaculia bacterium]